jgi:hypothetical protein
MVLLVAVILTLAFICATLRAVGVTARVDLGWLNSAGPTPAIRCGCSLRPGCSRARSCYRIRTRSPDLPRSGSWDGGRAGVSIPICPEGGQHA